MPPAYKCTAMTSSTLSSVLLQRPRHDRTPVTLKIWLELGISCPLFVSLQLPAGLLQVASGAAVTPASHPSISVERLLGKCSHTPHWKRFESYFFYPASIALSKNVPSVWNLHLPLMPVKLSLAVLWTPARPFMEQTQTQHQVRDE